MQQRLLKTPRYISIPIIYAILAACYFLTNHFHIREPKTLPFIFHENNIPFMGRTFIIYMSYLIQIPLLFALLPKKIFAAVWSIATYIAFFYCVFFFILPTTYPRDILINNGFIKGFAAADHPTNAFPSMHVFLSRITALACLFTRRNRKGRLVILRSLAIIISTLTTKQHYLIDIFASLIIASLAYFLVYQKTIKKILH